MLSESDKMGIRLAFRSGSLVVHSVSPAGDVSTSLVSDVVRHNSQQKDMLCVTTLGGRSTVVTSDHSLFLLLDKGVVPVPTCDIKVGDDLAVVEHGKLIADTVVAVLEVPNEDYTYDICVPGDENFVLANGVLAHNSYSIGGISLDIEKSSKYESLKQNAESQFDKAVDAKTKTVKIFRGLQQPKYGMGVKSAFGPQVGRGILSPRGFI